MRAFLGLEVPESTRRALSNVRARLDRGQADYSGLRWTRPENLHLTVRFLGDIDESVGHMMLSKLRGALRSFGSLTIRIEEITWFPRRRPTVLAASVLPTERLLDLYATVETEVVSVGLPPEPRPLNPHITIARVRQSAHRRLQDVYEPEVMEYECQELVLFESRLRRMGAVYTHFGEIALIGDR